MKATLASQIPAESKQTLKRAAPIGAYGACSTYAYKHGVPNGAFRLATTMLRSAKDACKVQSPLPLCHFWLSLPTLLILPA